MEAPRVYMGGFPPTTPEDIQNNNTNEQPNNVTGVSVNSSDSDGINTTDTSALNLNSTRSYVTSLNSNDSDITASPNINKFTTNFNIGSNCTSLIGNDNIVIRDSGIPSKLFDDALTFSIDMDEYMEDPYPELTFCDEYEDPSMGYEFVNDPWKGTIDNSEALLQHLKSLGIRVNPDYINLDFDLEPCGSRSASVSTTSEAASLEDEHNLMTVMNAQMPTNIAYATVFQSQPNSIGDKGSFEDEIFLPSSDLSNTSYENTLEDEVAEAEILPNGDVVVTYDNFKKHYRPRVNNQENYIQYLKLVHKDEPNSLDDAALSTKPHQNDLTVDKQSIYVRIRKGIIAKKLTRRSLHQIVKLPSKYAQKLRKFIGKSYIFNYRFFIVVYNRNLLRNVS